jgi:glycosyltransferase involved in cell wall biosynthesis
MKNKKVVIMQYRLLHYREDLFEKLKKKCEENSINLYLVHGQASQVEKKKKDEGFLEWAEPVKNLFFRVRNVELVWQPFPKRHRDADLVIVMQEVRILSNYSLIFLRKRYTKNLAYWGHGINFQSRAPNGFREKWKKILLNKVDWWFAYTKLTTELLEKAGFPSKKITNLNNSVDTSKFQVEYNSISDEETEKFKDSLGISGKSKIGVFCGSLYKDKKLDLLLASSEIVRKKINFHVIIIGAGSELEMLEKYSLDKPWVHLMGMKKGYEKALCFRASDVMLNPGLLGLHILDSFAVGIPIISTNNARHSPEIEYIDNGVNGILTDDDELSYSNAILKLLENSGIYDDIKESAKNSGRYYTLDNMVENFYDGIAKVVSG